MVSNAFCCQNQFSAIPKFAILIGHPEYLQVHNIEHRTGDDPSNNYILRIFERQIDLDPWLVIFTASLLTIVGIQTGADLVDLFCSWVIFAGK